MKKNILVLSFVALLAAGCGKAATSPSAAQNNSPQTQASGSNAQTSAPMPAAAYVSSADSFSVNFPGTPTVTNTKFSSPTAGQIPLTQYRQSFSVNGQEAYYTVDVYHYPASYKFPANYLNAALQTYVKVLNLAFPGTTITSQQPTEFQGLPALQAVVDVPSGGNTANSNAYLILTVKDQNTYAISTYGMDQSSYNTFMNSFKFAQ